MIAVGLQKNLSRRRRSESRRDVKRLQSLLASPYNCIPVNLYGLPVLNTIVFIVLGGDTVKRQFYGGTNILKSEQKV